MTPCTCHPGNTCTSASSCAAARRVEFGEHMTTTTPAMPELPEPAHRGPTGTGAYFDSYTADQMDARYLLGYNDALALRPQADHPDTARCIKARNDLNAALHGDGALIDDLEHAVANACAKLKRRRSFAGDRADFEEWMSEGGKWPKAVERGQNGDYLLLQTATNWTTWQACASLRPQSVPMTPVQIGELAEEGVFLRTITEIVSAIEAHHGVKENV